MTNVRDKRFYSEVRQLKAAQLETHLIFSQGKTSMRTNKLIPNDQDLSSILSEDAVYHPGLTLSRQVNALISIMQVAAHYGIKSPFQVEVFLRCAENQGAGIYDILGFSTDENPAEAKRFYSGVRQLMEGPVNRNFNGAHLLCWGDRLENGNKNGRIRKIELTMKGKVLRREIHRLLQPNDRSDS